MVSTLVSLSRQIPAHRSPPKKRRGSWAPCCGRRPMAFVRNVGSRDAWRGFWESDHGMGISPGFRQSVVLRCFEEKIRIFVDFPATKWWPHQTWGLNHEELDRTTIKHTGVWSARNMDFGMDIGVKPGKGGNLLIVVLLPSGKPSYVEKLFRNMFSEASSKTWKHRYNRLWEPFARSCSVVAEFGITLW